MGASGRASRVPVGPSTWNQPSPGQGSPITKPIDGAGGWLERLFIAVHAISLDPLWLLAHACYRTLPLDALSGLTAVGFEIMSPDPERLQQML